MGAVAVAGGVAFAVSVLLTPYLIKLFARRGFGQEIRAEGPASHQVKRGTPTMGGVAVLVALHAGYFAAHLTGVVPFSVSGLLVLALTSCLGLVGLLDDAIKIRRRRNLGLTKTAKLVGQSVAAIGFGVLALRFPDARSVTPAGDGLSFLRDAAVPISFGAIGFVVFCFVLVSAWSNAVNLTDGQDGLASGVAAMVLGSYVVITLWQGLHDCFPDAAAGCYTVRDPHDLALVVAAGMAACVGFLWWNAAPAKIFMGDTGSLALGGLLAGVSMTTRTELLMVIIGGVFVVEALSVGIQVLVFRTRRRRVFRMAPFHHHFELGGWAETTVIIRLWLLAAVCCLVGIGLFYADWAAATANPMFEPP
ncbi:phospho-N-acetylmuramoyl-pentapeptide-transferase [Allokutzneria sp. A3M-2-11 16]|uniref:phospho-N-acetylmuramoyl-pentapeptide- transferase n=1 Tax=Allokutzneria sp. A3M-2-11 16 TaxID=2962043 RepID=UPI0035A8AB95